MDDIQKAADAAVECARAAQNLLVALNYVRVEGHTVGADKALQTGLVQLMENYTVLIRLEKATPDVKYAFLAARKNLKSDVVSCCGITGPTALVVTMRLADWITSTIIHCTPLGRASGMVAAKANKIKQQELDLDSVKALVAQVEAECMWAVTEGKAQAEAVQLEVGGQAQPEGDRADARGNDSVEQDSLTVNDRMMQVFTRDKRCVNWSQRDWAEQYKVTPGAIAKTAAWRAITTERERQKEALKKGGYDAIK